MNLQPLNGYVLLKQVEAATQTAGGIYVPETAKKVPDEGVIKAKASGATDDIAIGDRVLYKKCSGEEIQIDGETFRLVPEGDLLAKFVESDEIPD